MKWKIGQNVEVQSRTWPGINKPGGCAKIIKVHMTADGNYIEGLDVKYLLGGGCEMKIDPAIVSPIETLERSKRTRRGREFLMKREEDLKAEEEEEKRKDIKCGRRTCQGMVRANRSEKACAEAIEAATLEFKENISSPQSSATFSTPPKKRKISKVPMKVTPIPKMVTTKETIDSVSPMTEDLVRVLSSSSSLSGHLLNQTNKKNSVARGLVFDKVDAIVDHRHESRMKTKVKATETKTKTLSVLPISAASAVTNQRHRSEQQQHQAATSTSSPVTFQRTKNERSIATKTIISQKSSYLHGYDHQFCHNEKKNLNNAQNISNQKKSIGVRLMKNTSNLSEFAVCKDHVGNRRYKSSAFSASFSRTKSAYGKNTNSSSRDISEENRVPLLVIREKAKQEAIKFMNEMIGHPTPNLSCDNAIANNNNKNGSQPIKDSSGLKQSASLLKTNPTYDEFLSNVYKVWSKVNEEEITVLKFKEEFQKVVSDSFTDDELDKHVKLYCDKGEDVMLSDGVMYRIN